MNLKQLKPKLNFIVKGNQRPRLTQIKVTKSTLECSDLETVVTIKDTHGMKEGLQNFHTLGLIDSSPDVDEYPHVHVEPSHRDVLRIDMSKLERCLQFASKDETRLYLNGVAVNQGHLIATDGHTLKSFKTDQPFEHDYILPSNSLKILIRLLKGYKLTGLVHIELNAQWATVENSQFKLSMRLIQRDYPKWQAIVPTKYSHEVNITDFNLAVDIKELFKETKSHSCKLQGVSGLVFITPKAFPDTCISIGDCDPKKDFEIGFNYSYLVKASNKKSEFKIKYNGDLNPTEVNDCIVMPLKL